MKTTVIKQTQDNPKNDNDPINEYAPKMKKALKINEHYPKNKKRIQK